jgi:hypothetical protein
MLSTPPPNQFLPRLSPTFLTLNDSPIRCAIFSTDVTLEPITLARSAALYRPAFSLIRFRVTSSTGRAISAPIVHLPCSIAEFYFLEFFARTVTLDARHRSAESRRRGRLRFVRSGFGLARVGWVRRVVCRLDRRRVIVTWSRPDRDGNLQMDAKSAVSIASCTASSSCLNRHLVTRQDHQPISGS